MGARVADAVRSGAVMAKVKVGPGTDPEALGALVASAGVPVAADANASLAGHEAAAEALAATGVAYLEQPCAAGDLAASARLAARTGVPIALDESLGSPAAVAAALAAGAGSLVNCKPARLGGLAAALRCAAVATAQGAGLFVGGMLETGVGRAPALALAAALAPPGAGAGGDPNGGGIAAGVPWCTDLGPSAQYFTRDLTPPVEVDSTGALLVRAAPGTGAAPDADAIAAATVRRWAEEPW
jgi:O-succinylbenzoate synthase